MCKTVKNSFHISSFCCQESVFAEIMEQKLKIGFLGGGKMAQAMAKGFVAAGKTNNVLKIVRN